MKNLYNQNNHSQYQFSERNELKQEIIHTYYPNIKNPVEKKDLPLGENSAEIY